MLQLKQLEDETEELSPRWNIGVDRRHVVAYVAIALIAGSAAGFLAGVYFTRKETPPPALINDARTPERPSPADTPGNEYRRVTRLLRGDTVEVEGVGPVRMIGIETPDGKSPREIYSVHGQRALSFVEKTLLGQEVRLEFDNTAGDRAKDDSGQTLAYVYTRDGTLINAEMVKQGLAFVRSGEHRLASDFRGYERDAMQTMRGVWGSSSSSASTVATAPPAAGAAAASLDDKAKRLAPLPPSALGANIPALSSSPVTSTEQSVWVSTGDKMYHKSSCDFLDKKKHSVPLSQAKSEGYTACSRCYASTVIKAP
ncbi:MAG TPA: thermonuclease family protein [Blastocatellia bacterium]|nr:thermonuclease family protein [Blastocatellia bacterium]